MIGSNLQQIWSEMDFELMDLEPFSIYNGKSFTLLEDLQRVSQLFTKTLQDFHVSIIGKNSGSPLFSSFCSYTLLLNSESGTWCTKLSGMKRSNAGCISSSARLIAERETSEIVVTFVRLAAVS